MLNTRSFSRHDRQHGLVLVLALIVLAAMSLAAIGLMRGVLGSNRVAGNLAAQQAAAQAADIGIERAVAWLEQQSRATVRPPGAAASAPDVPSTRLHDHVSISADNPVSYSATRGDPEFGLGQTWESYWQALVGANRVNTLPTDANGNQVAYAIHRLCSSTGAPAAANCEASPTSRSGEGGSKSNVPQPSSPSAVYYRITVRVQGPRNATSFIQAVVAI
jgi:Tfp pilus assembly protein PilX